MLNEVIEWFERLFEDVRNKWDRQEAWMERQGPMLANTCKEQPRRDPNARRQGKREPRMEIVVNKKIELIFDYQCYSEDKKVKITVLEFIDYSITW